MKKSNKVLIKIPEQVMKNPNPSTLLRYFDYCESEIKKRKTGLFIALETINQAKTIGKEVLEIINNLISDYRSLSSQTSNAFNIHINKMLDYAIVLKRKDSLPPTYFADLAQEVYEFMFAELEMTKDTQRQMKDLFTGKKQTYLYFFRTSYQSP